MNDVSMDWFLRENLEETCRFLPSNGKGLQFFLGFFSRFFLGFFSRFLGFDGFDWYLQRFAAKLSDLHGVVVVVVGWMDG